MARLAGGKSAVSVTGDGAALALAQSGVLEVFDAGALQARLEGELLRGTPD
jgi:hypothetical protein